MFAFGAIFCLVLLFNVIVVEGNSVTLNIPYDYVGEVTSTSYTTFKSKKYSFITLFKVPILI